MGKVGAKPRQRNKGIAMDYDFVRAQSEDGCYYCLTDQQVTVLQTMLEYVGWKTRWFSVVDTVIDTDWIAALEAELESRLVADQCDAINEKLDEIIAELTGIKTVTDATALAVDAAAAETTLIFAEVTTVVEPALAGLATAIAGVALQVAGVQGTSNAIKADLEDTDFGLAEIDADVDNIELLVEKLKTSITNVYNNSTTVNVNNYVSFGAQATDDSLTALYAGYNALCQAVIHWMRVEIYAVMVALQAGPTDLATLELQIDASFRGYWSTTSAGLVYSYTLTDINSAVNNATAMNNVACQIITTLANLQITQGNFSSMFAGFAPAPFTPEDVLFNALSQSLQFLDAYTNFVSILQLEFVKQSALNPTGYNCPPCLTTPDGCVVPATYDFVLGQKLPWLIQRGILKVGVGIQGQAIPGDPSNLGYDVSLVFPNGCSALNNKGLKFTANHLNAGVGNAWTLEFWSIPVGGGTPTKYNNASAGPTATYPAQTTSGRTNIPAPTAGNILYKIRWYTNTAYYANATSQPSLASILTKIEIVA